MDVVVAGYIGVDLAPGFPAGRKAAPAAELFRPGKLIETRRLEISLGGAVANTGLALKKFGKRVALMACVGRDVLGDLAMAQLHAHGVTGGIKRSRRTGTAYGIVVAPPGMDRMFLEDPGCNGTFTSRDIGYQQVAQSRIFHLGYPPLMEGLWRRRGAELQRILRRVRQMGVATSLDMALPDPDSEAGRADWAGILAGALPHVDFFVPSIEELLFMLDRPSYDRLRAAAGGADMVDAIPCALYTALANRVLAMGAKVLMIKAGHRGAYLRTADVGRINAAAPLRLPAGNWSRRELWIPAFPTVARKVRNACGAGDCAVAGFLAAILDGATIEKAARYAMLAGRDNLYGTDAVSGLSDWETMTAVVNRQPRGAAQPATGGAKRQRIRGTPH